VGVYVDGSKEIVSVGGECYWEGRGGGGVRVYEHSFYERGRVMKSVEEDFKPSTTGVLLQKVYM
jgi:hypothetical protein